MTSTQSQVLQRFLISIPAIVLGLFFWGTHIEQGDTNSGGMYVIVAFFPALFISGLCYIIYATVDHYTFGSNLNFLKHIAHLVLWLFVLMLPESIYSFALTVTVVTVLIVNLFILIFRFLTTD